MKLRGESLIIWWELHIKVYEVYKNKFIFKDNVFLEQPFGFHLVFCQTILLPLLQTQRLWFKI